MKAQKTENGITVLQADCFNPRDILECGQIFRFDRDGEGNYRVFSLDRYAEIKRQTTDTSYRRTLPIISTIFSIWTEITE